LNKVAWCILFEKKKATVWPFTVQPNTFFMRLPVATSRVGTGGLFLYSAANEALDYVPMSLLSVGLGRLAWKRGIFREPGLSRLMAQRTALSHTGAAAHLNRTNRSSLR